MKTKTSFHRENGIYVPCSAERYQPGLYLFATNRLPAFLSSATTPEANLTGVSVATANTNVAHFGWKGNKPTETEKHHETDIMQSSRDIPWWSHSSISYEKSPAMWRGNNLSVLSVDNWNLFKDKAYVSTDTQNHSKHLVYVSTDIQNHSKHLAYVSTDTQNHSKHQE